MIGKSVLGVISGSRSTRVGRVRLDLRRFRRQAIILAMMTDDARANSAYL